ncbi:hypothetical protein AciM339_1427 [Aciduliprofundum sp. MAR08-339]|uniref:hypothetical protein n=1 Tax=Aciduliprofundum sp. (strain MAR08-339) TaxID=673860 RepID=UPI0002A497AF|nr:hypothetical protein AciM339_1427 [Aciduliprofundum sp. MAR08-339]
MQKTKSSMETLYGNLEEIVRQGYIFRESVKYKGNTAYFYFISLDGEDRRNEKLEFENREDVEEIVDRLAELMKKMYGVAFYTPSEKKEDKKEKAESFKSKAKITATMSSYDKSFARHINILAEKEEWLVTIISELGIRTLFIILQMADIPPHEWYTKLGEYASDPQAFVNFAEKYIVALFEAKQDAKKMLEMRSEMAMLIAQNEALKFALKNREETIRDLIERLNALTSMLSKNQIQRYIIWDALRQQVKQKKGTNISLPSKEGGSVKG